MKIIEDTGLRRIDSPGVGVLGIGGPAHNASSEADVIAQAIRDLDSERHLADLEQAAFNHKKRALVRRYLYATTGS